uniref:Ig-like domain-containing protein n=1 Tax=Terrapene triunguis TaxID=2587831 RepID=A0A674JNK0_9SAUR
MHKQHTHTNAYFQGPIFSSQEHTQTQTHTYLHSQLLFTLPVTGCRDTQIQSHTFHQAGGLVTPGESLTVTCTVSGDSIATGAWWNWVRELPGRGLQWVGRIHFSGSTNYAPDLQTRANIAKDDAKNEYYLQLRSLTAADTATYYCTRWDPQRLCLFPVTIFLPSPKAPEIFPLCATRQIRILSFAGPAPGISSRQSPGRGFFFSFSSPLVAAKKLEPALVLGASVTPQTLNCPFPTAGESVHQFRPSWTCSSPSFSS